MKEIPKEITVCNLEVVLMPQGEVICLGKTVGWFKELKDCLNSGSEIAELKDQLKQNHAEYEVKYEDLQHELAKAKNTIARRNTLITDLRGQINDLKDQIKDEGICIGCGSQIKI